MRGVLVGRFQPFHLGHLAAVRFALSRVNELWLGVGSSNRFGDRDNPFSADERREMIISSLDIHTSARTHIFSVLDVDDHHRWIGSIDGVVPEYGAVFTADATISHIYARRGISVIRIPFLDRERLSGTAVRALIMAGGAWEELVPAGTKAVLLRIGAPGRLAQL